MAEGDRDTRYLTGLLSGKRAIVLRQARACGGSPKQSKDLASKAIQIIFRSESLADPKANTLGNGMPGGTSDQRSGLGQLVSVCIGKGAGEGAGKIKGVIASDA